jgi:hypothetical protein
LQKKAAKNSCLLGFGLSAEAQPEFVKVFGSVFQKSTAFIAACLPWRRSPYLDSYKNF